MQPMTATLPASDPYCAKPATSTAVQNVILDSDILFAHHEVVFVMHQGKRYSLRRTRNDKLILTK